MKNELTTFSPLTLTKEFPVAIISLKNNKSDRYDYIYK